MGNIVTNYNIINILKNYFVFRIQYFNVWWFRILRYDRQHVWVTRPKIPQIQWSVSFTWALIDPAKPRSTLPARALHLPIFLLPNSPHSLTQRSRFNQTKNLATSNFSKLKKKSPKKKQEVATKPISGPMIWLVLNSDHSHTCHAVMLAFHVITHTSGGWKPLFHPLFKPVFSATCQSHGCKPRTLFHTSLSNYINNYLNI